MTRQIQEAKRAYRKAFDQIRSAEVGFVLALKDAAAQTSQKQLADELGISPAYLNDVINGRRTISAKLVFKEN